MTPIESLQRACESRIVNSKRAAEQQLDHLQRTLDEIRRALKEDKGWAPMFNTSSILDLARELGKLTEDYRMLDEIQYVKDLPK